MSLTLPGSTETPPAEITCPRKETSVNQNSHLLNLAYNWFDLSFSNTNLGEYENAINEYYNKFIQVFHKHLIHEIHEIG
jgi:hypothetical protein